MITLTKKDFEGLPYCFTLFLSTSPETHLKSYEVLKFLPKTGIILTVSRPADNLKNILKEKIKGINLYFIDSISQSVGCHAKYANVAYITSPESLTEINIAIGKILKKLKDKESFFILDSLSKLTFYHQVNPLFKFMNILINKCRSNNIRLVILGIEDDLPKTLKDGIEDICDKTLRIK